MVYDHYFRDITNGPSLSIVEQQNNSCLVLSFYKIKLSKFENVAYWGEKCRRLTNIL